MSSSTNDVLTKSAFEVIIVHSESFENSKGHIVESIVNTIMAFEAHKIKYCLYSDNSILAEIKNILDFRKYSYLNLLENSFITKKKLNEVLNEIISNSLPVQIKNCKKYIFFPWFTFINQKMLAEMDDKLSDLNIKWSTFSHVSTHLRKNKFNNETNFLEFAATLKSTHKVFYWDTISENSFEDRFANIVCQIPEYVFAPYRSLETNLQHNLTIGFLGVQSPRRGIVCLTWLGLLNPNVTIVCFGEHKIYESYFPRIKHMYLIGSLISKILTKLVKTFQNYLNNWVRVDKYFTSEEFYGAQSECDAVFSAGHISPYSSAVSLSTIAMGTPVIWTRGNSANSDQMEIAYPAGELLCYEFVIPYLLKRKIEKLRKNPPSEQLYSFVEFSSKFTKQFAND